MPSPPDLSLDGTMLTVTAQAPPTGIEELALFFRKPNESGWINKKSIAVAKGETEKPFICRDENIKKNLIGSIEERYVKGWEGDTISMAN